MEGEEFYHDSLRDGNGGEGSPPLTPSLSISVNRFSWVFENSVKWKDRESKGQYSTPTLSRKTTQVVSPISAPHPHGDRTCPDVTHEPLFDDSLVPA